MQVIATDSRGSAALTGTIGLHYRGRSTSVSAQATAREVETALEQNLNTGDVEVRKFSGRLGGDGTGTQYGSEWHVTFVQASESGPEGVDRLYADSTSLGGASAWADVYDKVVVSIDAMDGSSINGSWSIRVGSEVTRTLQFNASADTVREALLDLESVGEVLVRRTGEGSEFDPQSDFSSIDSSPKFGYAWDLLFLVLRADVETVRAQPAHTRDFRGIGASLHTILPRAAKARHFVIGAAPEVQTIGLRAGVAANGSLLFEDADNFAPVTGQYKLRQGDRFSSCIDYGASTDDVRAVLRNLTDSEVIVNRDGDGSAGSGYAWRYEITFVGRHEVSAAGNISNVEAGSSSPLPIELDGMGSDVGCTDLVGGGSAAGGSIEVRLDTAREGVALTRYDPVYYALRPGTSYAVRVSATGEQTGTGVSSAVKTVTVPSVGVRPSKPTSVVAGVSSTRSSASLDFAPPLISGGNAITRYVVQWDTDPGFSSPMGEKSLELVNEVQRITLTFQSDNDRSGSFLLHWAGRVSAPLPWDVTAEQMRMQVAMLVPGAYEEDRPPIQVSRSEFGNGFRWSVTFTGAPRGDLGLLEVDQTRVGGFGPRMYVEKRQGGVGDIVPGDFTFEVQSAVAVADSELGSASRFALEFEGVETEAVSIWSPAAHVRNVLEGLSTIHTAAVSIENRLPGNDTTGGRIWRITYTHGEHETLQGAGNMPLVIPNDTLLVGTNARMEVREVVAGTDALRVDLENLPVGTNVYVRVAAYNRNGYGSFSDASIVVPLAHPGAVSSAGVSLSDSSLPSVRESTLQVHWSPPADNGGLEPTSYRVEQWPRRTSPSAAAMDPVPEVQRITVSAGDGASEVQVIRSVASSDSVTGSFVVIARNPTTGEDERTFTIDHDATDSAVEDELNALPSISAVTVSREPSFQAASGTVSVAQGAGIVTCDAGAGCDFVADGIQVGQPIRLGGIRFSVNAVTSTQIDLAEPSNSASTTTFTGVALAGATLERSAYGYEWEVTFTQQFEDQPQLRAEPATSFDGGVPASGEDYILDTFTLRTARESLGGEFRVGFMGYSTPPLRFDVSAEDMESRLEALPTVGDVDVERMVNSYGYDWQVTFLSQSGDLADMTTHSASLTGTAASAFAFERVQGSVPASFNYTTLTDLSALRANADSMNSAGGSEFATTLTGLSRGVEYGIRIIAISGEGAGDASAILSETPRRQSDEPANAMLVPHTSSAIKAIWDPPSDNGGAAISAYIVQWSRDASFSDVSTTGNEITLSVAGLIASGLATSSSGPFFHNVNVGASSQVWYVRVAAVNDQGTGAFANTSPAGLTPTNTVPGKAQDVTASSVGSQQLLVTWSPPNPNLPEQGGDGGLPLQRYYVEWETPAFDNDPNAVAANSVIVSASTTRYVIGVRDITRGTHNSTVVEGDSYQVRVIAYNAMGAGAPAMSTPENVTAQSAVPSSPQNVQVDPTPGSATSLDVSWSLPEFDGGLTLDRFVVETSTETPISSDDGGYALMEEYVFHETQAIVLEGNPVGEVQTVTADVEVTNERQTVVLTVDGRDEEQTISTMLGAPVVAEVQTVATWADDINEVQRVATTATDRPEVQTIVTSAQEVNEIQRISIAGPDSVQHQQIVVREPILRQTISYGSGGDHGVDGGNYVLNFGNMFECVPWNATAGELEAILENFVGTGNVASLTRDDGDYAVQGGYSYNIVFDTSVADSLFPLGWSEDLCDSTDCSMCPLPFLVCKNETGQACDEPVVNTTATNLAGTFRLRLDLTSSESCELCERPGAVYETTHLDVSNITQAAIHLRDTFDGACNEPPCVSVNVTDLPSDNTTENIIFDISFDKVFGDHPGFTVLANAMTGDAPTVTFNTTVNGSEASGTFTLTLNGSDHFPSRPSDSDVSAGMEWDVSEGNAASGMIGTLLAMGNVAGDVQVSRGPPRSTGAFEWFVTFDASNSVTRGNLAQLQCNDSALADGYTCEVETIRNGIWINGTF